MRHGRLATPLVLLLVPCAAFGADFLPLDMGNLWQYTGDEGNTEKIVVSGMISLFGETVSVLDYKESAINAGLDNFWTTEADGDVKLWGFYREVEEFGFAYFPPVVLVDAPLAVGNTWSTEADVFTYPGLEFQFTVDVAFQVVEEGILATPAGSFHAFGIGQEKPSPGVSEFALNGERSTTGPVAATRWYNDGVGPIQYVTDQLYQLEFFNLPVSIAAVSWGRVKSLYR